MIDDDQTDPELLRRFASDQDPEAFASLVAQYYGVVTGIGRRVLGDAHEAEDIAQSTFILLAEKSGGLTKKNSAELSRWIVGAAYRFAKNRRRQLGSRRSREEEFARRQENQEDHGVAETVATVDDAIARLPKKFRDAIIARYLKGLSYREVSYELQVSKDTVRGRLAQAKEMLRKQLAPTAVSTFAGVLSTMQNAEATPPNGFVQKTVNCSGSGFSVPLGLVAKIAALVAVSLSIGWLFIPPAGSERLPFPLRVKQISLALGITEAPFIPPQPDLARKWDTITADRLVGPLATIRRDVPDEDNGYFALVRLTEAFERYKKNRGEEWIEKIAATARGDVPYDTAFVAEALASFDHLFAFCEEILTAPDFQFPEHTLDLNHIFPQGFFAYIYRLKIEEQLARQDIDGAVATVIERRLLGERFATGQGNAMNYLLARTVVTRSDFLIERMLREHGSEIPKSSLKRLSDLVSAATPSPESLDSAIGIEYGFKIRLVGRLLREGVSSQFLSNIGTDRIRTRAEDPVQGLKEFSRIDLETFASRLDEERLAATLHAFDHTMEHPDVFDQLVETFPVNAEVSELTPEQLADYVAVAFTGDHSAYKRLGGAAGMELARQALLKTRLAIERAWHDGQDVASLGDLVPAYLPEIPTDPFDGGPLKFDEVKRVLYSIGKDRIDSAGFSERERAMIDRNEIVIPLPAR